MENLFRDAPISAPFATSSEHYDLDQLRQASEKHRSSLVSRVMSHDPRNHTECELDHLVEVEDEYKPPKVYWNKSKIEGMDISSLRELDTRMDNREEILKENPKLLY